MPRNSVIFGIPRKLRNVLPILIKVQKYRSKKNPAEFRGQVRPRLTQFLQKSINPSMLLKKPKTFLPHKALQALSYFLIYSHLILLGSNLEQSLSSSLKDLRMKQKVTVRLILNTVCTSKACTGRPILICFSTTFESRELVIRHCLRRYSQKGNASSMIRRLSKDDSLIMILIFS
jgi:hypothetical protein